MLLAALLARWINNFVRLTHQLPDGDAFKRRHGLRAHFFSAWHFFLFLCGAMLDWHHGRDQCRTLG